jgi:hypothetical protein
MRTQVIIPVLAFIGRNKAVFDLHNLAAIIKMGPDKLRLLIMDAEMNQPLSMDLHDFQIIELLKLGERLGVIHKGTEFEVLPVRGEMRVYEEQKPTEEFLAYAKRKIAEKIGVHMIEKGIITFDIIPHQHVKQRDPIDRHWQIEGKLQALKEK